ncbi:THO complex subunit [Echinococcus granulosus]|uniref:THO complex subunit n=1 Tax=Echinococcus granulosus TaxID=6210 RepID=W6V7T2_ECHGR|nr:THO complex subunit [Echinococcus granulosus]EUB62534.1 THO complex subunit [Echinococcus granulosus]
MSIPILSLGKPVGMGRKNAMAIHLATLLADVISSGVLPLLGCELDQLTKRVGLCVAELLNQIRRSNSMSKLNRYPDSNLVWRTATENAFRQKLKVLSALFVVLVSFLETEEEVSGIALFFSTDDELRQRTAALINVGIVGDVGVDRGQKSIMGESAENYGYSLAPRIEMKVELISFQPVFKVHVISERGEVCQRCQQCRTRLVGLLFSVPHRFSHCPIMTEEFVTSLKAVNNFLGDYPSKITLQSLKSLSESIKLAPEQKKSVMDLAFRERTLSLLSGSDSMVEVRALLRLAASAAVESICSASTPFLLFADLVNTKSIAEAEANFHFLEETIKALKDASLFGSGRNTLLRMCNDLLRRLSKSQNTVFCGRIQLFLTSLFPLNEKSGLNFTSNFNLEKEVAFNQDPDESLFHSLTTETDADGGEGGDAEAGVNPSALVNADLYRRFWRLQEVLKAPAHCYTSEGWKVFVECTECVVSTFQSIRLIAGCGSEAPWHQFTMYLTSEKLIDLQLMDRNFRRYILTQLVIIFQYLTAQVKFKK